MERKSTKSLAVNGAAAFFALISFIGLFLDFFKDGASGFDIMLDKKKFGIKPSDIYDWNVHIWMLIGTIIAVLLIASCVLNYLGIVKINYGHFVLMGLGGLMLLMAILTFVGVKTNDIIKALDPKLGIGFWLYFIGAILGGLCTIGTMFYKE